MPFVCVLSLVALISPQNPEVGPAQFEQIVKERSEPFKTVVFLYEGKMNWVGPPNLDQTSKKFDTEFQGTYLYRNDGAGLLDFYEKTPDPAASVVRKKIAVIRGTQEQVRGLLDAKESPDGNRNIRTGRGSLFSLGDAHGPQELFWTWSWPERGDLTAFNYKYQGWEDVEGHNCLRFQIDSRPNGSGKPTDFRRFWIDVNRNAHVVKTETFINDQLEMRNEISLFEFSQDQGKSLWFPAKSVTKWYLWDNVSREQPVTERTISLIRGSLRTNIELPDFLFTVRRATALPTTGELQGLEKTYGETELRRQFEAQPPQAPFRTDPASIRQRIDKNLAEADKQSKELEASSPARSAWNGTMALQAVCAVLGLGVLSVVGYWKWKGR